MPCYTGPTMSDEDEPKLFVRIRPASCSPKPKHVALYCRVSTKMERQLNSLSAQMDFEKQEDSC